MSIMEIFLKKFKIAARKSLTPLSLWLRIFFTFQDQESKWIHNLSEAGHGTVFSI